MTSTRFDAVQPDAKPFPFAELLADLRRRGFGIGLHEYRDVAKLASRWQGVDRTSFRDALAALLARDALEVEGIRDAFDEWADSEPPPAPPPPPARFRSWTWPIAAVVLIVVAVAVVLTWWYERDQPPVRDVTPPPVTQPTPSRSPQPELPVPPREPGRQMPWVAAAAAAIAVLLALAVRESRHRQTRWARRYWRHVLANVPGPHHYDPKVRPGAPPFPRPAVEEVATILGRAVDADATNSDVLDVDESLRLTLRAGMAPQLKFRSPPRNVPVLVLRDTAWQMRPWKAKVDSFVRELQRQGVVLEQWFFAGDPLKVSRVPDGPTIGLEILASSRSEASLMILSSGQAVSTQSLRELGRLLKKWNDRTWIHPAGNPEYWRRELEGLPLRIWPMTRAGVHAAAVELSQRGDMGVPPKMAPARSVRRGDIERLKQLLALAPSPSLELAQEIRRRFCPEVPEEVLLFLGAEGVFYGETISFPPEQLQQLLAAAARDPERERNVRRYLLEVLHESRPPEESAAYLRWQLDEAIQRVKLDPNDSGARDTIRDLAEGPLREEVQSAVTLHGVDVPVPVAAPKQLPAQPPPSLGKRPPLWAWPRLALAALAVVVVVPLTVLATRSMKAGAGTPVAHLRGAYTLRWDAKATRLFGGIASPAAPAAAALYRDGRAFLTSTDLRRVSEFYVSPENAGAWFELRATLPKGNLATSHPVWVPPASPPRAQPAEVKPGQVLLVFLSPDGTRLDGIRYILRGSGNVTPTGIGGTPLSAPPATYRVIVLDPAVTNRLDLGTVTVRPGASVSKVFVLRTRSEWHRDAISRRVVTVIMAQLNLTEEAIEPNSDLRGDLGADDPAIVGLIKAVEEEFGLAISDREAAGLRTPQQLVDFVRAATSRRGDRVEALLTFVSPGGGVYDRLPYQLVGVRQDFAGIGGEESSVSPGRYSIVATVFGFQRELGTVTIPAGRPFVQRIMVPRDKRFSVTSGGYAEVSPATAREMIPSRRVVVMDMRPASEFRGPRGHLPGALSVPFETIERQLPDILPYQNETILVYGNNDSDGAVAARLLTVAGFRYTVHLSGGLSGWTGKGYRTIVEK